jgi:hypothetical protein
VERVARSLTLVLVLAGGVAASQGLPRAQVVDEPVVLSAGCTYEFGTGDFKWCLSSTGNLQRLTSPAGAEHLAVGIVVEGYAICVGDEDRADYHDRGGLPGLGFGPPSVLAGPTSRGITISRTTLDGHFRLDQKWFADPAERDLTVEMTLHNLGAGGFESIFLTRFADLDLNGAPLGNTHGWARSSIWVRRIDAVSMIDRGMTVHSSLYGTFVRAGDTWLFPWSEYSGLEVPCFPLDGDPIWDTPATGVDVAPMILFYFGGELNPGDRAIARVVYRVE